MNKNLVLLTNHFPFGTGEAFLESEISWLTDRFDKVVVIARTASPVGCRYHSPNFFVVNVNPKSSSIEKLVSLGLFIKNSKKAITYLYTEFVYLKSHKKKITFYILKVMIHDLFKSLITAKKIENAIEDYHLSGNIVFYSYWFNSSALAFRFVSVNGIEAAYVTRAHRGDLYTELQRDNYLSFREVTAQAMNKIYPISDVGASEIEKIINASLHHKIEVSKLGTRKPSQIPIAKNKGSFTIVSVSSFNPFKRVHLIIEAIHLINDIPIHWIHFGDGPLRKHIEALANEKLAPSMYEFRGWISNQELIHFYENNYVDVFINTSSSEGIPVSIMEAQSFGIPCIATDVGGNREIVSDLFGKLIAENANPQHIANAIIDLLKQSDEEKENLRKNVINNWTTYYDSSKNYATFSTQLLTL